MIRVLKQMLLRVTLAWISGEDGGEGSAGAGGDACGTEDESVAAVVATQIDGSEIGPRPPIRFSEQRPLHDRLLSLTSSTPSHYRTVQPSP